MMQKVFWPDPDPHVDVVFFSFHEMGPPCRLVWRMAQMIPNATVLELVNKGIQTVNDLYEFNNKPIETISHNLR